MHSSKSSYKRFSRIGPGGWRCWCCSPPPGIGKKRLIRIWKRKERKAVLDEEAKLFID